MNRFCIRTAALVLLGQALILGDAFARGGGRGGSGGGRGSWGGSFSRGTPSWGGSHYSRETPSYQGFSGGSHYSRETPSGGGSWGHGHFTVMPSFDHGRDTASAGTSLHLRLPHVNIGPPRGNWPGLALPGGGTGVSVPPSPGAWGPSTGASHVVTLGATGAQPTSGPETGAGASHVVTLEHQLGTTELASKKSNKPVGLGLTDPQDTVINFLQNSQVAIDQQIVSDLKNNNPLTQLELNHLHEIAVGKAGTPVGDAAQQLIDDNAKLQQDQTVVNALQSLLGGSVLAHGLGQASGGLANVADDMPGLCDGYPVLCVPVDEGVPGGSGLAMAVDPATVADTSADDGQAEGSEESAWQTTRSLRVANATKEKVTVYVRVRAQNDDEEWVWYPGQPGGDKVLAYDLKPGQTLDLTDQGWKVNGSRVRLWAKSASRQYAAFRDKDLWLVPETEADGTHGYSSPEVQTFEVAIR